MAWRLAARRRPRRTGCSSPGGQLLLVKANGSRLPTGTSFEGVLTPVTAEEARQINDLLKEANLPPGANVLPMRLDVRHVDATAVVVDVVLLTLAALMLVLAARAALVSLRPAAHPVFTRLNSSGWGERLLDERQHPNEGPRRDAVALGGGQSRLAVQHDGRRPATGSHRVGLSEGHHDQDVRGGAREQVQRARAGAARRPTARGQQPQSNINAILDWLRTNMPWVLLGYSSELESMYHRRRSELVAAVDARRLATMRG